MVFRAGYCDPNAWDVARLSKSSKNTRLAAATLSISDEIFITFSTH